MVRWIDNLIWAIECRQRARRCRSVRRLASRFGVDLSGVRDEWIGLAMEHGRAKAMRAQEDSDRLFAEAVRLAREPSHGFPGP